MGRSEEPDKKQEAGGDARDIGEDVPEERNAPMDGEDEDEVPELDEGFEDERDVRCSEQSVWSVY
ncbi:hypothetical protein BIW11_00500 [Tropilaelaps mercedesae]|uniref:Uncharacterized protein n=1 Tax=Tropilaelaps mercedesae TaxID=418985 RepID=A0A1V9XU78_9ACAR|nr:hypothetical protein BIW11_00500 [Tropilaelaps mercedesae]